MRNKTKKIIIVLGLIFAFLSINCQNIFNGQREHDGTKEVKSEINLKNPKESGYWNLPFIHIDDNWSATASTYDWCSGDGSWSNPYTIENITINASGSPTGNGILIKNSENDYFIIRNCTVYNSLTGDYSSGIRLEHTNNGFLTENNCFHNNYGINLFTYCENNTISGNTVDDNGSGIVLFGSDNNKISGNNASGGTGIELDSSSYNNISGNNVVGNGFSGIFLVGSDNNIILGNTANYNSYDGMYLSSGNNNVISENIANKNGRNGIYLNGGYNNMVSENTVINNSRHGIILDYCFINTIIGNTAKENYYDGIQVYYSGSIDIIGNTANSNDYDGIRLYKSEYITVSGNIAKGNYYNGIYLYYSNNSIVSENTVDDTFYDGIFLYNSNNNHISNNAVKNNIEHGIWLYNCCDNNFLMGNTIRNNSWDGIRLEIDCNYNTITGNLIYENSQVGINLLSSCENNLIFYNYIFDNLLNNAKDNGQNYWDNGTIGNYWDDYMGIDIDHDGIGDTPYTIPGVSNSEDNKPIMIYKALFFEQPEDLIYEVGAQGNNITWSILNPSTSSLSFNIFRDGTSIKTGQIFPLINEISINVDGLDVGIYGFTIEIAYGNGGTFTDGLWVTVINTAPIFTAIPDDFSYEIGSTGNTISWMFSDPSIDNSTYTISRNGVPIIIDSPCISDVPIELSVDGLDIGTYGFTIEINDGYGETVLDNVWVTVINSAPIFTEIPNDLSYEIGSTGNNLSWMFSDISTNNPTYTITRNGIPIVIDSPCISDVPIELSVDGLDIGIYGFAIEINDGYGETVLDNVWVTVINSAPIFTEIPNDLSYEVGSTGNSLSWTFSDISMNNPTYTITRNGIPIVIDSPCISGIPIELSVDGLDIGTYGFTIEINDGYGETILDSVWVTVTPSSDEDILNLLYVEIIDQSFSTEEFNIIFSIHNESGQGIDSATIQVWWNGTEVSDGIQNLGNGLYSVSLDPITVNTGENPILLSITILAIGYENKYFETYIAVDPASLLKGEGRPSDGFPLALTIIIATIGAGAIFGGISIYWFKRRKRKSQ